MVPKDLAVTTDEPDTAAADFGLLSPADSANMLTDFIEDDLEGKLMLFQMPAVLPIQPAQPAVPEAQQASTSSAASKPKHAQSQVAPEVSESGVPLKQLPSGKIGKLLVFESGKLKMQIGDVLFDVCSGQPLRSRHDLAALSQSTGTFTWLGDVVRRAVVCPDVQQLIDDEPVPEFVRALKPTGELGAAVQCATC